MTEPGFMLLTMSSVTSTGAARPGINAVEMTTSAKATRLATSTFCRSNQLGGMGRAYPPTPSAASFSSAVS